MCSCISSLFRPIAGPHESTEVLFRKHTFLTCSFELSGGISGGMNDVKLLFKWSRSIILCISCPKILCLYSWRVRSVCVECDINCASVGGVLENSTLNCSACQLFLFCTLYVLCWDGGCCEAGEDTPSTPCFCYSEMSSYLIFDFSDSAGQRQDFISHELARAQKRPLDNFHRIF